ncbi:MAG: cytidine deaminase [Bacteroidia bacterium]|nr:cytidine deaminase [Bacteroidia bacterium]MCX7764735.1 cytidine deaminase [Bacteroidia bacterium]MDW8057322.1 cytidine deaminase [Bacteroidia bacterium]
MKYTFRAEYEKLLWAELSAEERELVELARKSAERAYAPYSNFPVGAAARLTDGRTFTGNNQENAALPSGLCAERTLLFYLGSQNLIANIEMLAVFAPKSPEPVMPCGSCRQVMYEYEHEAQREWILIFAGAAEYVYRFVGVKHLLPFAFVWRP